MTNCRVFIIISLVSLPLIFGFSCKQKKAPLSEKDFPGDSINKWNARTAEINRGNEEYAKNNPYHFTDSVRHVGKVKGAYRIAVLGDSFIWGDGIPYHNIWSHKLEEKLSNKYQNVEVMSWGLCGWSTMAEYEFFKKEGYKYNADLLVIAFVENDPDMGKPRLQGQSENDWQISLYEESNLREYGELLKKVATIPEKSSTKLLFVITPLCIYKDNEERKDKVVQLLKDADISYLDLYPAYKGHFSDTPCRELFATPVNGHPGDRLNEMCSDELMNYLEAKGYLSAVLKK
jgi:hypothetical protein